MQKKICPLCNKEITGERVPVVTILAGFATFKDDSYSVEATRQAILSHVQCPES